MTMDDATLLREYTAGQSEGAFTQLVKRHVDLVHSVAFRCTRNHAIAEDIAQTVFHLLAQKADRLVDHPCLGAWLHRTTTHLSLRRRRSEQRRQLREALAVAHLASDMKASPEHEPILERLDEALEKLGNLDRTAIVSRFFLEKSMKEVGDALGTTEAAAKMRVGRALERLRIELIRRGASCSPAGLAAVLHSSSITPAPSHLPGTIAHHLATGSAASVVPSSFILSFLLMSSLKSKTVFGTVIVLALLGGARFWLFPEMESPDNAPSMPSPATPPFPSAELGSAGASPAVVGRRLSQPLSEADLALARQQLRDALSLPVPKSGITWPEPRVLEALERFGNRSDGAFAVLREVIGEMSSISEEPDSPEAFARDLARSRALLALGTLDRDLPGLRPYLWERQRTGPVGDQFDSFMSLKRLGFQASDAPALVETLTQANTLSLALNIQVTQAVRDLGLAHPEALKPFTSAILGLLDHSESRIQLRAAATLIGWPEGNDPRVLEHLRMALGASGFEARVAIAAAEAAGEQAQPLIPDLLRYAETAKERGLRGDPALRAVAQIRPDLGETHPDVAALQARTAESERIRSRMQSPTRTFEDLVAGLRDPASAVAAANALADWGPSAIDTLSGMRAALAGMDEDRRDRVVEAMRRIDPTVQVERVPADTVFSGVVHATTALPRTLSDAASRRANERVDEYQMFRTWRTPEELVSLVRQLSTDADPVAEAFLRGIAEKDPELATRLRRAAGGSGR